MEPAPTTPEGSDPPPAPGTAAPPTSPSGPPLSPSPNPAGNAIPPRTTKRREITTAPWTKEPKFLWVWIRPRGVLRDSLTRGPSRWLWLFPTAAGFLSASLKTLFNGSAVTNVAVVGAVGALFGYLGMVIGAAAARLLGRIVGGVGTPREMRVAGCWTGAAALVQAAVLTPLNAYAPYNPEDTSSVILWSIVRLPLFAWTLIINLLLIAEAHRFSAWRSALAGVIGALVAVLLTIATLAALLILR